MSMFILPLPPQLILVSPPHLFNLKIFNLKMYCASVMSVVYCTFMLYFICLLCTHPICIFKQLFVHCTLLSVLSCIHPMCISTQLFVYCLLSVYYLFTVHPPYFLKSPTAPLHIILILLCRLHHSMVSVPQPPPLLYHINYE